MRRAHLRASSLVALASATIATVAVSAAAIPPVGAQASDPFAILRATSGSPVTVPPRALAVIPERHTGRPIRVVDVLERIEPQFDDLARGVGLASSTAIQLRTVEANIPIFVPKSDATISTVLQLRLGSPVEVTGLLVERGNRYLMLASEVRSASGTSAPRAR